MEGSLLTLSLVCGLATWRLCSLLHTEDAFEWLRRWIGIENDEDGYPVLWPGTLLGGIFHCFWCLTLVVSLAFAAMAVPLSGMHWAWFIPVWLSASAVAIWLEKQIMRTQSR